MHALLLLALLSYADEPITEIALERGGCFGTCPVDFIVLRSDGTAEYTGKAFVKREGKHKGKVSKEDFDRLAALVVEKKFFDLNKYYSTPITDHATLITTVKRGKDSKRVSNYAKAAPKELGEIEKAIVSAMDKIEWEKVE